MRLFALFLLTASVWADEVVLDEVRAWHGRIQIEARSEPGKGASGTELQTESVDFVVVTDPRFTAGARERLQLRLRQAEGEWKLKLDLRQDQGSGDLVTQGSGEGKLLLSLTGTLDPTTRRVVLKTGAKPHRLVAQTMLSGVDAKGLAAFRTVASRLPYLGGLEEQGELSEDGRTARGERTFVDRRGTYPRKVVIRWSLERLDPEVRGRVVDGKGEPAAGLRVLARTWRAGRMILKEGVTGADGRFSIPVHFASWGVQVVGREEKGVVTSGLVAPDAAMLRFDSVPDLELEVKRYRLALLPRPELLASHFQGDVDGYLEWVTRRASPAALARAEVKRATN